MHAPKNAERMMWSVCRILIYLVFSMLNATNELTNDDDDIGLAIERRERFAVGAFIWFKTWHHHRCHWNGLISKRITFMLYESTAYNWERVQKLANNYNWRFRFKLQSCKWSLSPLSLDNRDAIVSISFEPIANSMSFRFLFHLKIAPSSFGFRQENSIQVILIIFVFYILSINRRAKTN